MRRPSFLWWLEMEESLSKWIDEEVDGKVDDAFNPKGCSSGFSLMCDNEVLSLSLITNITPKLTKNLVQKILLMLCSSPQFMHLVLNAELLKIKLKSWCVLNAESLVTKSKPSWFHDFLFIIFPKLGQANLRKKVLTNVDSP